MPLQVATAWYISAPLVFAASPGSTSASLSTHTYMVRPLELKYSDISHPAYSSVHPLGHRSVPGIMS